MCWTVQSKLRTNWFGRKKKHPKNNPTLRNHTNYSILRQRKQSFHLVFFRIHYCCYHYCCISLIDAVYSLYTLIARSVDWWIGEFQVHSMCCTQINAGQRPIKIQQYSIHFRKMNYTKCKKKCITWFSV